MSNWGNAGRKDNPIYKSKISPLGREMLKKVTFQKAHKRLKIFRIVFCEAKEQTFLGYSFTTDFGGYTYYTDSEDIKNVKPFSNPSLVYAKSIYDHGHHLAALHLIKKLFEIKGLFSNKQDEIEGYY